MRTKTIILTATSAILCAAAVLTAQQPQQPASQAVNEGKAAAETTNLQALLKATDEEWRVINPKLQAVVTARQAVLTYTTSAARFGGFGGPNFGADSLEGPGNGFGGRGGRGGGRGAGPGRPGGQMPDFPAGQMPDFPGGGRGGPGGPGGNNQVGTALTELKTALADATSAPEQIKARLAAVRAARRKAASDLAEAQKALLPLLTPDQEVTLVSLGYID